MEKEYTKYACEILNEINKLTRAEEKIRSRKNELIESLRHVGEEGWDWIPVKDAAKLLTMSDSYVYQRINKGNLSNKYIGSDVRVRRSEIMEINDKYSA